MMSGKKTLVAKPLWLAWVGEEMPALSEVWRLYLRRFAVDHWYRFARATPSLDSPQTEYPWHSVSSGAIVKPMITWELWLARDIVTSVRDKKKAEVFAQLDFNPVEFSHE